MPEHAQGATESSELTPNQILTPEGVQNFVKEAERDEDKLLGDEKEQNEEEKRQHEQNEKN